MNKNVLYGLIVVAILAVAGFFGYQYIQDQSSDNTATQESNTSSTPTPTVAESTPEVVSYQGEEGKTALALLQENAEVEMSGEGEMAFVTSINGVEADSSHQFWAFYVNGEQAQVGAGSYTTKASDEIEWKLEEFSN